MDLQRLHNFSVLAKILNFSKASEKLYITQPALSTQIKLLEEEFNTKLFNRDDHKITLTKQGHALLEYCPKILSMFEDAKKYINDISEGVKGNLIIGTVNSVGIHILPSFLKVYMEKFPEVSVKITYKNAETIISMLNECRVDAAIMAGPISILGYEKITFMKSDMWLVSGKKYKLGNKNTINLAELDGVDFIAFEEDTPSQNVINSIFSSKSIKVNNVIESENIETMKKMVEIGMGVAILPEHCMKMELKRKILKKIDIVDCKIERDVNLFYKKERHKTKALLEFIEFFRKPPVSID